MGQHQYKSDKVSLKATYETKNNKGANLSGEAILCGRKNAG